ncbi:MAG: nucleotidyltransferase domain-containing protein [Clostridia bacterium]|nr:nucleotidyltransferase domain-containing protein [Clostridia bacterium]
MNQEIYTIPEIAERIIPVLEKYGIKTAYIFGSYARGDADRESDIDLFIDASNLRGLFILSELYDDLHDALKKEIDLVTMSSLKYNSDKDFVQNLRKESVLLYECA